MQWIERLQSSVQDSGDCFRRDEGERKLTLISVSLESETTLCFFKYIIHPHSQSMRCVFLLLFLKWENQNSERLRNLPKVTQQVNKWQSWDSSPGFCHQSSVVSATPLYLLPVMLTMIFIIITVNALWKDSDFIPGIVLMSLYILFSQAHLWC